MQVLLLDEITVDLDVLGRADLMRFLVEECAARGASIIYATHIFDGLEFWPTHVAYVARGEHLNLGLMRVCSCSALHASTAVTVMAAAGDTARVLLQSGHCACMHAR